VAATFYVKRHDTAPMITASFAGDDGVPIDFTGSTVTFNMKDPAQSSPKINGKAAVIVDGPAGILGYSWASDGSDTDVSGTYRAEFQAVLVSGRKQTVPNPDYLTVVISDDLDNV
jgi:hypothetical protein